MKFYLLFDYEGKNLEFISELSSYSLIVKKSPACRGGVKRWLLGAYNALKTTCKGDAIICWFDFQAVLMYWLSLFTFSRREIFAINIMLKDRPTIRNKIVAKLYKKALTSSHFHASVTSADYGVWLNNLLGIQVEYSLVRDVVISKYYAALPQNGNEGVEEGSIFCGGGNARDWNFIIQLAREMTDNKFYFVMRGFDYEAYKEALPTNVTAYHDIKHEEFSEILRRCEVLCMPLNSEAPSGLMVLFESVYHHKPIFMTKTVTSSAYVNEERGYALPNDLKTWINAIKYGFAHREEMQAKAEKLYQFINTECSEKNFVKQLDEMIDKYIKR